MNSGGIYSAWFMVLVFNITAFLCTELKKKYESIFKKYAAEVNEKNPLKLLRNTFLAELAR